MAKKKASKAKAKIETVMHEFKEHSLKSGSKKGPTVTNKKQALAIAINESKKEKGKVPMTPKRKKYKTKVSKTKKSSK